MRTQVVLVLTGPDRIGIVEEVTGTLLDAGANVETSRMVRLGGEFAILMLVSAPVSRIEDIRTALAELASSGYQVTIRQSESPTRDVRPDWPLYRIDVQGADHEGIIHALAEGLFERGINIESMETETSGAPVTGTLLFSMSALVSVPPEIDDTGWIAALDEAADAANVDVEVSAVDTAQ